MALSSYPMQAALRPDCMLAVFPFCGGSVINPLHSGSALYPKQINQTDGSYAVQHGLLEYDNVKITPDGFAAEDPQKQCHIYTPLDFRDNCTSKTFIARVYCNSIQTEEQKINPIITQGSFHGSAKIKVFSLMIQCTKSYNFINFAISVDASKTFFLNHIVNESFFNTYHNVAVVVDYDSSPGNVLLKMYLDGTFIEQNQHAAFSWYHAEISDVRLVAAIRTDASNRYLTDNIVSWAMIFDSVLSYEEIRAFG